MTQWFKKIVTFFLGEKPGTSATVNPQITDSVTAKKPVANKAARKPAAKKTKR